MQAEIIIRTVKCERCGHKWAPRVENVKTCPSCRSPYWDTPRKVTKTQSQGESNEK
jgi:predicted Zn-ribbon and HTH transcriptional regulator